jgi:DNA-binding LacI/PurR family transcriptional regulator/signal transduction histidine kinase
MHKAQPTSPPVSTRARETVVAPRRRPSIAVLIDYMSLLDGSYQSRIGEAFHEAACRLDVDLSLVFGRAVDEPSPFSSVHAGIYDLVQPHNADGVVMISTVLAAHCGTEGMIRFAKRFGELPIASVGVELPSVPSVLVDNLNAMEAVVEHVVGQHRRRKVAFLAGTPGSPESEVRLEAYRIVLDRHGIPFDPALVGYARFMHWPARQEIDAILERTGTIDAVIAANDSMALGAIAALRERGLSVPEDVAVTGFDDVWLGRLGDAALTTISQPFEGLAEEALSLVLQQMDGVTVTPVVRVPADVIVRRSCGCAPGVPHSKPVAERQVASSAAEHLRRREVRVASLLDTELGTSRAPNDGHGALLFAALREELLGSPGAFVNGLDRVLGERGADYDHHQALHNIVDALRNEFRPVSNRELDDLWYQALSLIAYRTTTAAVRHRVDLDNEYSRLLSTADRISVALDLPTLGEAIAASLVNVGLKTAFISRFDEERKNLVPLAAIFDGEPLATGHDPFLAQELVPPGGLPVARRRTLVVFPLVFELDWLGVAAFEHASGGTGYHMLRDQFATALGHVTLHEQVLSKTMLHERSVQERQATTRRLEALGVLAGGVAHDLNNTLGPLVVLPDIALNELSTLRVTPDERTLLDGVAEDIRCIKSAGVRAAQTIKDLLTLGRQGHAPKEALDLNQIVSSGLSDPLRLLEKEYPGVKVRLELGSEAMVVVASDAHVTRAVTNLVRNAAESIPQHGDVVVRTRTVDFTSEHYGYEAIPPGRYAAVSISDTGNGIPAAELSRVFEPFFSNKRMGERSGSGLGLAIVHGVAKEHEGFVDLASRAGQGTTFTLYFPRAVGPSRVKSVPPIASRGSARVLVVDDDPIQGRTAHRVLTHLGYDADVMESGTRALELLEDPAEPRRYDVLLLDVMLNEELDGWQLLDRIRKLDPEQRAVLASGRSARRDPLARGVSWVAKPYTLEGLSKAIEATLPNRAA